MIGARKLRCRSGPNNHATSLRGITEGNGKRPTFWRMVAVQVEFRPSNCVNDVVTGEELGKQPHRLRLPGCDLTVMAGRYIPVLAYTRNLVPCFV